MKKIIVDEALLNRLDRIEEDMELCDASGRVLGVLQRKHTPEDWAKFEAEQGISLEELERLANAPGKRYTTEEVLAHLRSL